ncbi:hypothetical protein Sste5346_001634 [Sporothrix stenoceras]|uniref:Uncharacterized protein n=1 Tax=Sporothrix stenoceras TaxID=5173 RepID=A0ABR3ZN84_9PEZI
MSAYNDAISAYAHAKSMADANKAAKSSSSYTTSSAASVYSDTSSYYPVKDNNMKNSYGCTPKSSKSSSLKNWTKNLVSDLGKSPTHRYDAAHSSSMHSTNAVGAPYWDNTRHTKM